MCTHIRYHTSQLSVTVTKKLRKPTNTGKALFWLNSFRGFSPWSLDPITLDCGGTAHGRDTWQKRSIHFMIRSKDRKEEKDQGLISPSRTHLQWPNSLPLGPTFQRFHNLPIVPSAINKVFNTWVFERSTDLNYSRYFTKLLNWSLFIFDQEVSNIF
jgi:hypothetical protein